jgi:hypothetical protein
VVNTGLRPRVVVFFFRDENLTDTLFRVYPSALDRVARHQEPILGELLAARSDALDFSRNLPLVEPQEGPAAVLVS